MNHMTLKELSIPLIKSIDSFNHLLKFHHRRVAIISYHIGKELNLSNNDLVELVIAASLHDIGALSIQERNTLIKEDVSNPIPHCIMGYNMLSSFHAFESISKIIKHHHVVYEDENEKAPFLSYVIHLADRVDIMISHDEFILNQKNKIIDRILLKSGTVFHPDVIKAFLKASKADIFWIHINNMSFNQLFKKIDFTLNYELNVDKLLEFSLTISKIIDFRSRFTASHSYTVANLASLIGSFLGYSEEKCKKLKIAGYLHDIGKIGVQPELIEKNGPLTNEEFNQVKLHVYYTEQILDELCNSEWMEEIVTWAKHHHEKIDGSGYPYSIKNIDEGSKILAYADIITALMEDRPYREGMDIEKAFEILEESFSKKISVKMFNKIKENKIAILHTVLKSKTENFEKYNLINEEVNNIKLKILKNMSS